MTIQEKVKQELHRTRRELEIVHAQLAKTTSDIARNAATDPYGLTPGLALASAALEVANQGTRARELSTRIDMLEWLLREESDGIQL